MDQHDGGIFTGWRATRDYKLAAPPNPNDLVGARASAMLFDEDIHTVRAYFGPVKWDDNDVAQYTYWELSNVFKYEDPAHVALQFRINPKEETRNFSKKTKRSRLKEKCTSLSQSTSLAQVILLLELTQNIFCAK
jgi:hypothetical protein